MGENKGLKRDKPDPFALAKAMRAWRQSRDEGARERLWAQMARLAEAGAPVFESAHFTPCAVQEAICSGSVAAVELMALAASRSGEDFALGLNQTDCSAAFGRKAEGEGHEGEALLELVWLCGDRFGEREGQMVAMIERLVELGADPEGHASARGGPVMMMASLGLARAALALIKAGADPNRRDRDGDTALHKLARRSDDMSLAWALLVEAGADPGVRNSAGLKPAESADPAQARWLGALREKEALEGGLRPGARKAPAPRV